MGTEGRKPKRTGRSACATDIRNDGDFLFLGSKGEDPSGAEARWLGGLMSELKLRPPKMKKAGSGAIYPWQGGRIYFCWFNFIGGN